MRRVGKRHVGRALALAGAAATLTLAGCNATGSATFHDDGTASLDVLVTLSSADDGFCLSVDDDSEDITSELLPSDAGETMCRVTAERLPEEQVLRAFWGLGRGDGHYHLAVPASLFEGTDAISVEAIDLSLTFPGPVVASAGASSVSWNTVRWTDAAVVRTEGVMVVALDHAGVPRGWLLAGAVGATAGLALAGLTLVLTQVRRRWERAAVAVPAVAAARVIFPPHDLPGEAGPGAPPRTRSGALPPTGSELPREPEDPEVWSRA